jgi:glucose-6-phosphate 1-dehydrogenase
MVRQSQLLTNKELAKLQILCMIAMSPPSDLTADSIRDEKVKVLKSLRRLPPR